MSEFAQVLSETSSRLTVPEGVRSRILLELAADMEGLHAAYLERGHSSEEAHRSVLDHFDLSDSALQELVRVHDTPLQGMLNGIAKQAASPWEKLVLGVLGLSVAYILWRLITQEGILAASGVFLWPVVAVFAVALLLGAVKLSRLLDPPLTSVPGLRSGVSLILGMAFGEVFLGVAGIWIELYRVALRIPQELENTLPFLLDWLEMASGTLSLTLGMAMATALLWHVVAGQVARVERLASEHILES
ncbi:hypothetical protein ACFL0I_01745 [Gemmatimonadota bacterium]